ncbi:heavy metal transporter [Nakamurella flava]|uniref:Heavy metal transporter n=1 Tax=Nakamurella flava TaxID=2576308 RepID=A0A4U6QLW3_9ACTN|nr:heavy metal transporter [Nakamurella flava]TKV61560.1 heavy metal transporter [Nakamurella flava]
MRRSVSVPLLVVGVLLVLAVAGVGGFLLLRSSSIAGPECTVAGDAADQDRTPDVDLTAAQLQHASTVNAVGLRRGLPERARVIALATAFQESSLRNRPDGDRDSVGLFQQRPSQGWGTPEQILDPVYASGRFYDALVEVPGWTDLPLTEAAQAVQYSGHPDAYAKWEPQATTLARGLGGRTFVPLGCRNGATDPAPIAAERAAVEGLSGADPRLTTLLEAAQAELGGVAVSSVGDDGRTATVTASVPDLDPTAAATALAAWTVAHGTTADVATVTTAGHRWAGHEWVGGDTAVPVGSVTVTVA